MAANLKDKLITENCESIDSPVSTTRLKEMYGTLIFIKWTKIKNDLKSENEDGKLANELIRVCTHHVMTETCAVTDLCSAVSLFIS